MIGIVIPLRSGCFPETIGEFFPTPRMHQFEAIGLGRTPPLLPRSGALAESLLSGRDEGSGRNDRGLDIGEVQRIEL
jgi:hypothetical protein